HMAIFFSTWKAERDGMLRVGTHIRWMVRSDMPEVLAIERAASAEDGPWDEATYIQFLREKNVIGMVAERGGRVVGLMVYALHRERLELMRLGVHPDHAATGVGTSLVLKLKDKLSPMRRQSITTVC